MGSSDVYSYDTIGEKFVDERLPKVDPKMAEQLSPTQLEALVALRSEGGKTALARGNTLVRAKAFLYIPTTTARSLERRGLVGIRKEQLAWGDQEVVTLTERGNSWLDMATGKKRKAKKPSKRQRQQVIDDLVDVLRSGRP